MIVVASISELDPEKCPGRRVTGAGRGGDQPKPLHTDDVLGDIPAGNADREHLGHECRGHPVQRQLQRFLGGRRADSGDFHRVRDRPLLVQVQVLLKSRNLSAVAAGLCWDTKLPSRTTIVTEDVPRTQR